MRNLNPTIGTTFIVFGLLAVATPVMGGPLPGSDMEARFSASQPNDDVRAGYRIARDICRSCHVINPEQTTRPILRQPGPNFEDIANRPGLTLASLSQLIASQNWDLQSRPVRMPKQALSGRSTAQVAAYILSLRK